MMCGCAMASNWYQHAVSARARNTFLFPTSIVRTCFRIDQYPAWIKAAQAAVDGGSASLKCSSFTNNAGMQSKYFGQAKKDAWNSAPKTSAYNPRGFVCTSASPLSDHSVEGLLSKGF